MRTTLGTAPPLSLDARATWDLAPSRDLLAVEDSPEDAEGSSLASSLALAEEEEDSEELLLDRDGICSCRACVVPVFARKETRADCSRSSPSTSDGRTSRISFAPLDPSFAPTPRPTLTARPREPEPSSTRLRRMLKTPSVRPSLSVPCDRLLIPCCSDVQRLRVPR